MEIIPYWFSTIHPSVYTLDVQLPYISAFPLQNINLIRILKTRMNKLKTPPTDFDPNANKVTNSYGGYDPNEKGITQYPKFGDGKVNNASCSFQHPFPPRDISRRKVFSNPILDPAITHYRRFVQDPGLLQPIRVHDDREDEVKTNGDEFQISSCCTKKSRDHEIPAVKSSKPIDPVHWKPDLFDTPIEKYYLRNILNEDPYRDFLTSCSKTSTNPLLTEYKEQFSGNPTLLTSSLGTIPGISRPTDITESCDWRRNRTSKLRDVVFTHEKDGTDSNLDYNDPKRYNPWGRHLAGHSLLVEKNYRPGVMSGVGYSVVTALPGVGKGDVRGWFV